MLLLYLYIMEVSILATLSPKNHRCLCLFNITNLPGKSIFFHLSHIRNNHKCSMFIRNITVMRLINNVPILHNDNLSKHIYCIYLTSACQPTPGWLELRTSMLVHGLKSTWIRNKLLGPLMFKLKLIVKTWRNKNF